MQRAVVTLAVGLVGLLVGPVVSAQDKAAQWYTATPVADHVWRLDDHGSDNMYLVEGKEKALLVDTGLGRADILQLVRTLTAKPLIVVNTHGHPDHAGGNPQFEKVHAGARELDLVREFSKPAPASAAARPGEAQVPEAQRYKGPARETVLVPVSQGFVFDLGGTRLEVIEVPGHTPGGICLLDRQRRLLFTGDNDNTQEWMFLAHSTTLTRYLETLQVLQARSGEFDTLLPGHGPALDKGFLDEQVRCAKSILDGSCQGEPHQTFAGSGRMCSFERASIVFDPARLK